MLVTDIVTTLLQTWLWNRTNLLYKRLEQVIVKYLDVLLFLLIKIWLALLGLSEYRKYHVYSSQGMMIIWRSVLSRWSKFVANMPASVILHLLLVATHASSAHTSQLRNQGLFSHCQHYFLIFSNKKDNYGFLKYVFAQLSINLATLGFGDIL